jgi:hypothetical protein
MLHPAGALKLRCDTGEYEAIRKSMWLHPAGALKLRCDSAYFSALK